jgi:hypothetical protein
MHWKFRHPAVTDTATTLLPTDLHKVLCKNVVHFPNEIKYYTIQSSGLFPCFFYITPFHDTVL